jgi:hypothetical protein
MLLIVADGPRADRPGEAETCAEVRSIVERVDWDCDVRTNYAEHNLGCKRRVASGLDWVFSEVEEAIILEDDCLPEPSFFGYCAELLERYRSDERVGTISGDRVLPTSPSHPDSYYFSRYAHIWGWATWRRAWAGYDAEIQYWPELRRRQLLSAVFEHPASVARWTATLDAVHAGRIDTWDYQWNLHGWRYNRLSIVPSRNLVSNIGFGPDATHTTSQSDRANRSTEPMPLPLRPPPFVQRDASADAYVERACFAPPPLRRRVASRLAKVARRRVR